MSTKIAVIEGRWHQPGNGIERNTTVRPLFEFLSNLYYGDHHAFEYEMVGTKAALDEALSRLARSRRVTAAYLAMHGNREGLHLISGDKVSRTQLKNTLRGIAAEPRARIRGLYLGACLFGDLALARFLFGRKLKLQWIAGYKESVDFTKSSALDLLFFTTWLAIKQDFPRYSERQRIGAVAERLRIEARGLCLTPLENGDPDCGLGFGIFVPRRGRGGGVEDLLRDY
jgi:hypothetical protein